VPVNRARLDEEIEEALGWLVEGRPADGSLELDAREAIRQVLLRHGVRGARILVQCARGVLHVDVQLPPELPRVRQVRLRIG
jgi:hypothetical protein